MHQLCPTENFPKPGFPGTGHDDYCIKTKQHMIEPTPSEAVKPGLFRQPVKWFVKNEADWS